MQTQIFFKIDGLSPKEAKLLELNLHAIIISRALFAPGSFTVHLDDDMQIRSIEGKPILYKRRANLQELLESDKMTLTKYLP